MQWSSSRIESARRLDRGRPHVTSLAVPTAIAFESVTKQYRNGKVALNSVSWSIGAGSRVCLLGPNGAGKSTSIRLIEGALGPTAGSVELLGVPVGGRGYDKARLRTGIVPQGPGMYPDLTAAALTAEPDVLLLDEPTVGLDPKASHDVHQYLTDVMQGRTCLLCTHNLAEAEALCDQVIILQEGRLIVQGRLEELRRGARPRVRLAARQGPDALRARLGQVGPIQVDGTGVLVEVADPTTEAPMLLRRLLDAGLDVYECTPVRATLEDVFLEAVR